MALNEKAIEALVIGAENAASRSRWTLGSLIIVGIAQLSVVYNYLFSQWRPLIEHLVLNIKLKPEDKENYWLNELHKLTLKGWTESLSVGNNLIGVRFSAVDAGFVAVISIFILYIWLYFSSKSEHTFANESLSHLRVTASTPSHQETLLYLNNGLMASQMFRFAKKSSFSAKDVQSSGGIRTGQENIISYLLVYMPAISVAISILLDALNFFYFPAIFRGDTKTYFELFKNALSSCPQTPLSGGLVAPQAIITVMTWYFSKILLSCFILFFCFYVCHKICKVQNSIDIILDEISIMQGTISSRKKQRYSIGKQRSRSQGHCTY